MSTLREAIKEKHHLSDLEEFDAFYKAVVSDIGINNLIPLLPCSKADIQQAYQKDPHLNSIPIALWDHAAGFYTVNDRRTGEEQIRLYQCQTLRTLLYRTYGVIIVAPSQMICILKTAAVMYAAGLS